MEGLSLVIPAWNEEGRLGQTLQRYCPALKQTGIQFEIIVVADGSTDKTEEVAEQYAKQGVRTISVPDRLGKGGAIVIGLREARFEWSGFVDADGPVTSGDLLKLVEALSRYDCAIASRLTGTSEFGGHRSLGRSMLSRLWNLTAGLVLFLPLRDIQCGVKMFRTSVVRSVLPSVALTNWAFDASLLFHLRNEGYQILEVPVHWTNSLGSKLNIARDGPLMFVSLLGIRAMSSPIMRYSRQRPIPASRSDREAVENPN
jgi:dolichol-phosphate mannosyltransferase